MFRRLDPQGRTLGFNFDGRQLEGLEGESVAAALLAAGVLDLRQTPVSGAPRASFCLMGLCFECLVEIDGQANRQACMTPLRDGMTIGRQRGAPALRPDRGP